jgi:hypothetical protein
MKVLNKHKDKIPPGAVYIGRPSIFGNPFPIKSKPGFDRASVIRKYREYFLKRIAEDRVFLAAVQNLRSAEALVCFCAPEACHGDVIVEWLAKNPPRST